MPFLWNGLFLTLLCALFGDYGWAHLLSSSPLHGKDRGGCAHPFFLECCDLAPAPCIPAVLTTTPPTSQLSNKSESRQVGKHPICARRARRARRARLHLPGKPPLPLPHLFPLPPSGSSRQLSNFPTSRKADKLASWQVGKGPPYHAGTTRLALPPALHLCLQSPLPRSPIPACECPRRSSATHTTT